MINTIRSISEQITKYTFNNKNKKFRLNKILEQKLILFYLNSKHSLLIIIHKFSPPKSFIYTSYNLSTYKTDIFPTNKLTIIT